MTKPLMVYWEVSVWIHPDKSFSFLKIIGGVAIKKIIRVQRE